MLLCAGLGTRLGALSNEVPKPLLPVCGFPIVRYGIANLVAHGIKDLVINTHHLGAEFAEALGDGTDFGARIQYCHELDILGTGGGLRNALPLLDPDGNDEPFVSLNGKLIFDLDIGAVLRAFADAGDVSGIMVVRRVADAERWGAVDVDGSGLVRNILGAGEYMFCGVHVTRPSFIARLPEGESCSIRQGYLPWIRRGEKVAAYVHKKGYFSEHSTPKRYLQSNLALLDDVSLRHPPGPVRGIAPSAVIAPDVVITDPVRIGEEAIIEPGAHVGPGAVVGDRAKIRAESSVADAVIWPGSTTSGKIRNAVVTPRTIVSIE